MAHFILIIIIIAGSIINYKAWLLALLLSFAIGYHFISRFGYIHKTVKLSQEVSQFNFIIHMSLERNDSEEEKAEVESKPRVLPKEDHIRPWEALVTPNVSDALSELMEEIVQKFIIPWYSLISTDTKFPNERRSSLRYASVKVLYFITYILITYVSTTYIYGYSYFV